MERPVRREAGCPAVQYIPLEDVGGSALRPTGTRTYCPYKGGASYYALTTAAGDVPGAVWTYEKPYEAVGVIAGHVAFYPRHGDLVIEDE
jgi:uncharacterized protein (DUF427 family)